MVIFILTKNVKTIFLSLNLLLVKILGLNMDFDYVDNNIAVPIQNSEVIIEIYTSQSALSITGNQIKRDVEDQKQEGQIITKPLNTELEQMGVEKENYIEENSKTPKISLGAAINAITENLMQHRPI